MTIRNILVYPDPRLRQMAKPVTSFGNELVELVNDMAETMYAAPGIGLAAVQINVPKRVVVMDLEEEKNSLQVFINPQATPLSSDLSQIEEGCLSVPGFVASVDRIEHILIQAQDTQGNHFEIETDGLLSICIQHEIDHLNGKVFVDYLSRLKQDRVRKMLEKEKRKSQLRVT